MKKALSLILALVMIFALATVAFADFTIGGSDGVPSFTDHEGSHNVDILVSLTETQHRYAVDVEYINTALSLTGGTLTWDVNKLEYVTTVAGSDPAQDYKDITIINYSDMPVWAYVAITDKDLNDGLTVASANEGAGNALEIAKAKAKVGDTPGQATSSAIRITLTPATNWQDVVLYYTNKTSEKTVSVATATVHISMTDPATP